MAAIFNQDFLTFTGDDVFPIFTVHDSAGAVVDISTVSEITWIAELTADSAAAVTRTKSLGQIAFVTNGADGKFQVTLPAAVTSTLTDGWYQHLAKITDALGNVTTVTVGRMQVGVKPTWTYSAAAVATVPLFQVRRLIGDVIQGDQQLQDSEILFAISQRSSIMGAAADCCRFIAGQYSRKVATTSPGPIQTDYSTQATRYLTMAGVFDQQARIRGAGVAPYAGGISRSDKTTVQQDTDRVQPSFNIGMDDSTLPVAQIGNLTPTIPTSGSQP